MLEEESGTEEVGGLEEELFENLDFLFFELF